MTHRSENVHPITINRLESNQIHSLNIDLLGDACLLVLPKRFQLDQMAALQRQIVNIADMLHGAGTLIIVGEIESLVCAHAHLGDLINYHLWVSIKRKTTLFDPLNRRLPQRHFGALVYTKYSGSLKHTKTRLQYTYCPACDKTTKDYGGKKHTYNSYGTLISDVWRDISCDFEGDLSVVFGRFADLFAIETYQTFTILDLRDLSTEVELLLYEPKPKYIAQTALPLGNQTPQSNGRLILGDSLENLKTLASESVDYAFIDPPYNLGKKYNSYADDLSIQAYFHWCDQWLTEVARVLKPGCTVSLLNIPLWSIRHFLHLDSILNFQNWIVWDALSFPVRKIMPANYSILCFSKGESRPLPGLTGEGGEFPLAAYSPNFSPYKPLQENYCVRASCIRRRGKHSDRGQLSDLWWDIHRLKHNSRRVDHPTQLPPQLLYRLISMFSKPNDTVLDCFNGAGTTTLAAHQLGRDYIGIELSEKYFDIATERHLEIGQGLNPFRKQTRKLTEKNNKVARLPKKKYVIPKKTLQLEVRTVSIKLGHLPNRDEMIKHGSYPIKYYDEYFSSWGEVCAAARHDGMSEVRLKQAEKPVPTGQMSLFNFTT